MNRKAKMQLAAWLAFAAFGTILVVVAYLWGDDLFGFEGGIAYVAVAAGILSLFARSFATPGKPSLVRAAVIAALAVPVGFALASPASINPDVRHVIEQQAIDRAARAELAAVFASDPAFGDLSASTQQLKVVWVTIRRTLGARADLDRLRGRIEDECPAMKKCSLSWDVALRKPGE